MSAISCETPHSDANGNTRVKDEFKIEDALKQEGLFTEESLEKGTKPIKETKTCPRPSKKLKLDLQSTVSEQSDIKSDLVVSLEKLDPKVKGKVKDENTEVKTKKYKEEKDESSLIEKEGNFTDQSPTLSDKSPTQETFNSEKNTPNVKEGTKDSIQGRSRARVNKRKFEQEHDRRILGNSPPYFKLEDDILSEQSSIPLDQVLGSVIATNLNDDSRGSQVRASARVIKKMRLEAVAAPSTSKSEAVQEKKEKKEDSKPETKQKAVRVWTHEEKSMFFEAVSEYGKDFENIYMFIHTKLKKRGVPDDQNRTLSQVRQFYYKIFHEVWRHVKFSDKLKKVVQELYAIINYGELYKKLGTLTEKSCIKLAEMIYRGSTVIKYKGRTLRVKTPMCRALRTLNQLEDNYEELQLPNRVTVEIRPKDMVSFYKVQSLAQNPRLKTALPLQKRLGFLLMCLNKRWKTQDVRNFEKALVSSNPITNELVPDRDQISGLNDHFIPPLRLSPPADAKIELPSINLSEYLTRQTICLTAFEGRLGLDTYSDLQLKKKTLKPKVEVEQKCDINYDKEGICKEESEINSSNEAELGEGGHMSGMVDDAVNTILSLQQKLDRQDSEQSESEDVQHNITLEFKADENSSCQKELKKDTTNVLDAESLEKIENIKKGWTEVDCNSLTIGELYLMYGADTKLVLEYSWDVKEDVNKAEKIRSSVHFLERWSEFFDDHSDEQSHLSHSLSKLLSIAKIQYRRNVTKCSCGHICPNKPSHNQRISNTSTPRVRKLSMDSMYVNADLHDRTDSDMPEQENSFLDNEMINFARAPFYIQPKPTDFLVPTMEQQLNSLQKLKPKYTNRKGRRPRSKQVVVERQLPLLPNNIESGHQIVRMNIISQEPTPEPPALEKVVGQLEDVDDEPAENPTQDSGAESEKIEPTDAIIPPNTVSSAITISSPSRILKEGEWMGSEVADYSLSSLLGHLESPVKMPGVSNMTGGDLSTQVDAHLQSLLTQSSLDFAASFAELARATCEGATEDETCVVKKDKT